jgi:hypothetical protein
MAESMTQSDEWVIGPGVRAAMEATGDSARSDEIFVLLEEGNKVSQTFGSQAIYWWYESENAVKRCSF